MAYSDVRIGEPIPDEVLRMDNNVVVRDEEPGHRREEFWEQVRPYSLSEKEKGIYAMVDSVQHVPLYRNIYTLINTVIVGYWNTKYIGIGPYYKLGQLQQAGRLPHAAGRAHDDRSEPHGARRGATWPTARATRT